MPSSRDYGQPIAAWVGWERTGHRPSPKIVVTALPRFGGDRRWTGHAVGVLNSALMTPSRSGFWGAPVAGRTVDGRHASLASAIGASPAAVGQDEKPDEHVRERLSRPFAFISSGVTSYNDRAEDLAGVTQRGCHRQSAPSQTHPVQHRRTAGILKTSTQPDHVGF
jgi:hypothetical protein